MKRKSDIFNPDRPQIVCILESVLLTGLRVVCESTDGYKLYVIECVLGANRFVKEFILILFCHFYSGAEAITDFCALDW